ncbi:hypothetical protein [Sphingomonas sp. Root241]|uniref:hypothetical protein n=1 Tax=Sphingomonas sp. Root241 TaxID=1736501 RepID=UPI0012E369CC|nr:hypothetical protein [Sphingomonas sp. Root241]
MLFRDFFPRLRDHAFERYGQVVTERQFKDWREDGLLPGPAASKGRGRGKSPERHWPIASYRRALRICRYKSWGGNRQSQWWLGFWLSGEAVAPSKIRSELKRECSIERRRNHSFITSDRWRETRFRTVADAERGGIVGEGNVAGLLALTKMTPDQYRRLSILQLDETSGADAEKLIHEMAPSHFDLGPELDDTAAAKAFAEIRADIASDEIKRLWRSGHMDREGIRSGKYLDDMPDSDFATCLQILRLRERIAKWNYALSWLMGNRSPEKILLNLLPIQFSQASSLEFRISQLIRIAFEIDADRREGHNSTWRLDGIAKAELQLRMILQRDNSKFR